MDVSIAGEYYLEGMREMASGFLFRPDGSFQFFFTYGAMDRFGSGKWVVQDGLVLLNSQPKPASDFTLVKSSAEAFDFINVKMEAANPALLPYVYCSLQKGAEGSWKQMNSHGDVQFPKQPLETISLILEFCPERFSTVPVTQPEHNEFIFRFEQTIMEVFFENFTLRIKPNGLGGHHPLMEGEDFSYAKQ